MSTIQNESNVSANRMCDEKAEILQNKFLPAYLVELLAGINDPKRRLEVKMIVSMVQHAECLVEEEATEWQEDATEQLYELMAESNDVCSVLLDIAGYWPRNKRWLPFHAVVIDVVGRAILSGHIDGYSRMLASASNSAIRVFNVAMASATAAAIIRCTSSSVNRFAMPPS